jgi:hypothetical protein
LPNAHPCASRRRLRPDASSLHGPQANREKSCFNWLAFHDVGKVIDTGLLAVTETFDKKMKKSLKLVDLVSIPTCNPNTQP